LITGKKLYFGVLKLKVMKEKILMVLCLLFGLGMIVFGANKLVPFMPMPELTEQQKTLFGAFGTIKWLMPLIGVIEILGGLLIAIPKTRALGAIIILPVMTGIIIHNITYDPAGLAIPAVFAIINILAIADNKNRYMPMIK
jgi:putative oxidoreductase